MPDVDDGHPLSAEAATELMREVATAIGARPADAEVIARHLVDDELRGVVGMSRIFILAEDAARDGPQPGADITVTRDGPSFAVVDGGWRPGLVVAEFATSLAIEKARTSGVAVVTANRHRYSGTLAYYVEQAARQDLVAMAVASGTFGSVAPYGARAGRLDTNPIAFGFPTADQPIVWDIATSAISGSEVYKRFTTGEPLPDGVAVDDQGQPTTDPQAALAGALLTWGGHKGSGLAMTIRLLALLCGVAPFPDRGDDYAFLIVTIDPALLLPLDDFRRRAAEFAAGIRATPPAAGAPEVRVPYDRSLRDRERRAREGIVLPAAVYARLQSLRAPAS
jgi:LDH2 family malate/lactate/ureidoglycolate dehydrogenase